MVVCVCVGRCVYGVLWCCADDDEGRWRRADSPRGAAHTTESNLKPQHHHNIFSDNLTMDMETIQMRELGVHSERLDAERSGYRSY